MKAAIYSRKSKFTGKGESTHNQIKLCKEYAKSHFEIDEFIIYEDEGFSGGDVSRPQFQKMLEDVEIEKFSILICYRLDRISRNISDFSQLIELLQNNDIGFVSIREQFDTSTPLGRAMMYIASVFAQLERETTAERIRDNLLELAKTGRWLGGNTPTGYESKPTVYIDSNMKEKKMYELSPVEEELELVSLIYKKYLECQSLSQLESFCIQNNIKTKKNKYFYKYSLKNILTNPVYAMANEYVYNYFDKNGAQITASKEDFTGTQGVMAYNKKLVKKGKSVKNKDISEWIVAIGRHKGIIPGKDWVRIQEIITKNKSFAPKQNSSKNALLSGFLRCAKCGAFMQIKYGQIKKDTKKRHYYYVCSTKQKSKGKLCINRNLIGEKADYEVVEALKGKINSGRILKLDEIKNDLKKANLEDKKIQQKIDSNKRAISNLLRQLYHNENPTVSQYIFSEIEKLDIENEDLEYKINNAKENITSFNIDLLKRSLIEFPKTVNSATYQEKRSLLKSVVAKIDWTGEELNINLLDNIYLQ